MTEERALSIEGMCTGVGAGDGDGGMYPNDERRLAQRRLEERFMRAAATGALDVEELLEHRRLMEGVRSGRIDPREID